MLTTRLAVPAVCLAVILSACGAWPTPTAAPPRATPTRELAVTPAAPSAAKRVLFINGDHVPETGYPHSRVRDDGAKPESFSKLRAEVLEGDLMLGVDEFVMGAGNAIDAQRLAPYAVVVLGANGRALTGAEAGALMAYYAAGGSLLVYADFQYGPDNWASDNAFLALLGIEVLPDNFQPRTRITDVVASNPIMQAVREIEVEGISQFLVPQAAAGRFNVLARCSPLERGGCALQPPERARVKPGDTVACVLTREDGPGRFAGLCDRNPFHNGPQKDGTDLDQADNRALARNLFRWLARV